MRQVLETEFAREILACLALHPEGIEIDRLRNLTAGRVRAKKTFDTKFEQSIIAVLANAPFEIKSREGTTVILPKARALDFPIDLARFRQILLESLPEDGSFIVANIL